MALALTGTAHVDVESLLWEMRDLLRGLSQINKAQSVELERLGGTLPHHSLVATEYEERAQAAVRAVDVALDQLESRSEDDGVTNISFDANVAAWVQQTSAELGLVSAPAADTDASEPFTPAKDVPNDFWNTHEFKWDEEPEELPAQPSAPIYDGFVDPVFDTWSPAADEDELSPLDSVTERGGDDDDEALQSIFSDDEEDVPVAEDKSASEQNTSSNDDSATLFHSTPADDESAVIRAVERHAFVTGQKARALVKAAGLGVQEYDYMLAKSAAPRPVPSLGRPRACSVPAPQAISLAAF